MALTRTIAETILVSRVGPMMLVVHMAVTIVGTNSDCDDPLAFATRAVGGSTASHDTVTNAELALVASTKYDDLMTLAEYRLVKNILGACNAVDWTTGPFAEKYSQFHSQLKQMLANLEAEVAALGIGLGTIKVGKFIHDFANHGV